jgi:hypothetical protein
MCALKISALAARRSALRAGNACFAHENSRKIRTFS